MKIFQEEIRKAKASSQYNSCTVTSISTGDFILIYELVLNLSFVGFTQPCQLIRPRNLMPKLNYMPEEHSVYWCLNLE